MKILITSIIDLNKSENNRLHNFIKYLCKNNEITVLCINDWWKAERTESLFQSKIIEDNKNNVKIYYFTKRKISPIFQEIFSFVTLNQILNKIDFKNFDIHFNYNSLIAGLFVESKIKKLGINTIYDIADDLPSMVGKSPQIPNLLRPLASWISKKIFQKNINTAQKITITMDLFRKSLNIPLNKCFVLSNGVDINRFKYLDPTKIKAKLGLTDELVLGYVGVLREWVDLEPIFKAIKILNEKDINIKGLIIGDEGGLVKNKLLANKYQIEKKIIFTGSIPYSDVPEYISCMDIGTIPFKEDLIAQNALPLKLFEYMACERPVISTDLVGIKDIVGKRVIFTSNLDELEKGIELLFYNKDLRSKMGAEGRKFTINNYSWDNISAILENILIKECKGNKN